MTWVLVAGALLLLAWFGYKEVHVAEKLRDIADYAREAGFSGGDLVTSVAVAMAESGGNLEAYNPETHAGTPEGKGSYGLWQIYLEAHPEFEGWDLFDPFQNAKAAYHVYLAAGRSFRPWSTFRHGSHVAFLEQSSEAVNA